MGQQNESPSAPFRAGLRPEDLLGRRLTHPYRVRNGAKGHYSGRFSHLPEANTYIHPYLAYLILGGHETALEQTRRTKQTQTPTEPTESTEPTKLTEARHNMLQRLDQIGCAADPHCGPSEVADRSPIGSSDVLRMVRDGSIDQHPPKYRASVLPLCHTISATLHIFIVILLHRPIYRAPFSCAESRSRWQIPRSDRNAGLRPQSRPGHRVCSLASATLVRPGIRGGRSP